MIIMQRQLTFAAFTVLFVALLLSEGSSAEKLQYSAPISPNKKTPLPNANASVSLSNIYRDESHCLTIADIRGDQDKNISCFCRDAIVDARYMYFSYIYGGQKDQNLNGSFLALVDRIQQQCGNLSDTALNVAMRDNWKWNGPEVVRTYPSDSVVSRIEPKSLGGKVQARSVPFTIQLIFRDDKGHITRTENYSSREDVPEF